MRLNNNTCIFINSCDKTHDIAKYFLFSFKKYIKKNNFKIFIGINEKEHSKEYDFINYVKSPKTNWKYETLFQLNILKKKYKFKNVILILDDFIFNEKTNMQDIYPLLKEFDLKRFKYLCQKKWMNLF